MIDHTVKLEQIVNQSVQNLDSAQLQHHVRFLILQGKCELYPSGIQFVVAHLVQCVKESASILNLTRHFNICSC
jgi:hypothetical protein